MAALLLLPVALAVSSFLWTHLALAQCDGPSVTIVSQADADSIANCSLYNGNVLIQEQASGQISLGGVQEITGDLVCQDSSQLQAIEADQLRTIGGNFSLGNLETLSSLTFPSLTSINYVYWSGLHALSYLDFGPGVRQANVINIDTTFLNNLNAFQLDVIGDLWITNNPYLTTISMPTLSNITGYFYAGFNAQNLNISLTALLEATSMTLYNISDINMPVLKTLSNYGSFSLFNSDVASLALPALTEVALSFEIVNSTTLANLTLPKLTAVGGGILLYNNTQLNNITLPQLQVVSGAMDLAGNISTFSLPSLKNLTGGINVQTSSNVDICAALQQFKSQVIIVGRTFTCLYNVLNPGYDPEPYTASTVTDSSTISNSATVKPSSSPTGATNSSGTFLPSTHKSGSSNQISGGGIAGIVVGVLVALFIITVVGLCLRRLSDRQKSRSLGQKDTNPSLMPELPMGEHYEKSELPAQPGHVSELACDRQHTAQLDQGKEVISTSRGLGVEQHPGGTNNTRIIGPQELVWNDYREDERPHLHSQRNTTLVTEPERSFEATSELETGETPVKRKPVGQESTSRISRRLSTS